MIHTTDEEADTVGCCSLRVEHMKFDPNSEGGDNKEIELEFLGKDSMLFKQTIDFGQDLYNENNGMGTQVFANLEKFCKKKKQTDEIFDKINPSMLNAHLKQFMDGLTAKVFRCVWRELLCYSVYRDSNTLIAEHTMLPRLFKTNCARRRSYGRLQA